jgi:hypothetical protein
MSNHINRTLPRRSILYIRTTKGTIRRDNHVAFRWHTLASPYWLEEALAGIQTSRPKKLCRFSQLICLLSCESQLLQMIWHHVRCSMLWDISAIGLWPHQSRRIVNLASYLTFRHFRVGEKQKTRWVSGLRGFNSEYFSL